MVLLLLLPLPSLRQLMPAAAAGARRSRCCLRLPLPSAPAVVLLRRRWLLLLLLRTTDRPLRRAGSYSQSRAALRPLLVATLRLWLPVAVTPLFCCLSFLTMLSSDCVLRRSASSSWNSAIACTTMARAVCVVVFE